MQNVTKIIQILKIWQKKFLFLQKQLNNAIPLPFRDGHPQRHA